MCLLTYILGPKNQTSTKNDAKKWQRKWNGKGIVVGRSQSAQDLEEKLTSRDSSFLYPSTTFYASSFAIRSSMNARHCAQSLFTRHVVRIQGIKVISGLFKDSDCVQSDLTTMKTTKSLDQDLVDFWENEPYLSRYW